MSQETNFFHFVREDIEKRLKDLNQQIDRHPDLRPLLDRLHGYSSDQVVHQMTQGFFPGVKTLEGLETTVSNVINYLFDDGDLFWVFSHKEANRPVQFLTTFPERELDHPKDASWVQLQSIQKLNEFLDAAELAAVTEVSVFQDFMDDKDASYEASFFKGFKKEAIEKLPEKIRKYL